MHSITKNISQGSFVLSPGKTRTGHVTPSTHAAAPCRVTSVPGAFSLLCGLVSSCSGTPCQLRSLWGESQPLAQGHPAGILMLAGCPNAPLSCRCAWNQWQVPASSRAQGPIWPVDQLCPPSLSCSQDAWSALTGKPSVTADAPQAMV